MPRITSKGQVTIPLALRSKKGLLPGTEVEFEEQGQAVKLVKVKAKGGQGRGRRIVTRLRASGDVTMSTDEILALTRS